MIICMNCTNIFCNSYAQHNGILYNVHHGMVVVLLLILFDDVTTNQKHSVNQKIEIVNGVPNEDNINDSNKERFFGLLKVIDWFLNSFKNIIINSIVKLLKTVTEYSDYWP